MLGSCLLYGGLALPLPFWIPAPYRGTGHASIAGMTRWGAGMTNSVAGTIHPGSESGTCFHTNGVVGGGIEGVSGGNLSS